MKKSFTKVVCLLSAALLVGAGAGCRSKNSDILQVNFTNNGDATYMEELTKAFTEKTGIPVQYTSDDNQTNVVSTKLASVKNNDTDLFLTMVDPLKLANIYKNTSGYSNLVHDLTPLLSRTVPGKDKTLGELLNAELYEQGLAYTTGDETAPLYSIPWHLTTEGFIYNKLVLDAYGITELPRTTDELEEVADILLTGRTADGKEVPADQRIRGVFTSANNAAYWQFVWITWWAQYEGLDNFRNYLMVRTSSDEAEGTPSWEALRQQGKLVAIQEVDRFLNRTNGYMHPEAANRDNLMSQIDFLDGEAAFIPSGDWIEKESASDYEAEGTELDFRMMRTPVTSSLGVKLGISEEELRAAIDYADGKTEEQPAFAGKNTEQTASILQEVSAARSFVLSANATFDRMIIPAYSNKIEDAYQFILFLASDEGQEIMLKYTGAQSPFGYVPSEAVYGELSSFQKSCVDIVNKQNTQFVLYDTKHPMMLSGGLELTSWYSKNRSRGFELSLYENRETPLQIYNADWGYYKDHWNSMLIMAGYNA